MATQSAEQLQALQARLRERDADLTPRGPDSLFEANELDKLMRALQAVRATAIAP